MSPGTTNSDVWLSVPSKREHALLVNRFPCREQAMDKRYRVADDPESSSHDEIYLERIALTADRVGRGVSSYTMEYKIPHYPYPAPVGGDLVVSCSTRMDALHRVCDACGEGLSSGAVE